MEPLLLILHQSSVRTVDEREAFAALSPAEVAAVRQVVEIDTRPFSDAIDKGEWDGAHGEVLRVAQVVRSYWEATPMGRVIHAGLGEVPCLIALGAYLGDEHRIRVLDLHRDTGLWSWPEEALTHKFEVHRIPRGRVEHSGIGTLRVEAARSVEGVDAPVGADRLADVVVRPTAPSKLDYGMIRSEADTQEVRHRVRQAHAAIMYSRPGIHTLHIFVAGPPSVCIAVGEEMRIRNGPVIQTYRHRSIRGGGVQTRAILISPEALEQHRSKASAQF